MRDGKFFEEVRNWFGYDIRLDQAAKKLLGLLEEAAEEFPYRKKEVSGDVLQELLKLCRDRHIWNMKWFGVSTKRREGGEIE